MRIKRIFARGAVLSVAVALTVAGLDAAHAATKKSKHAKSPQAAHATSAPSTAQPTTAVAPPDPGVYK
jgi:hypothetical protein